MAGETLRTERLLPSGDCNGRCQENGQGKHGCNRDKNKCLLDAKAQKWSVGAKMAALFRLLLIFVSRSLIAPCTACEMHISTLATCQALHLATRSSTHPWRACGNLKASSADYCNTRFFPLRTERLAKHGIQHARMELGWGSFAFDSAQST